MAKAKRYAEVSGIRYPIAPYRRWLERLIAEQRAAGKPRPVLRVAENLGVSARRIYNWRYVDTEVDEAVVDTALSRDGRWHLADLYPDRRQRRYVPTAASTATRPVAAECARPGCVAPPGDGRFCAEHAEELLRIRAEFEADSVVMRANGGAPRGKCRRRRSSEPVCCNPDCCMPRVRGERFCADCRAAGWYEDDDGITNELLEVAA